jgi:hypothetical protein
MGKMISETDLRLVWQAERGYYSPGFRCFVDLKVGFSPDIPVMPPLPRHPPENLVSPETTPPTSRSCDSGSNGRDKKSLA